MRPMALLILSLCVACGGPPEPDPDPPPSENLFALETTPGKAEFKVARGEKKVLEVRSVVFSPLVKKVLINISGSSGASIEPKSIVVDKNATATFTVSVDSAETTTTPYFSVNGSAQDASGNSITANQPSITFKWDATPGTPAR
jgi:hypothetical protein